MYGITGVPSLVLFHNGKPIAKYNGSDYTLYEFTKFVIRHTGMFMYNGYKIIILCLKCKVMQITKSKLINRNNI